MGSAPLGLGAGARGLTMRFGLINHLIMSVQWPGMPQSLALDELHMLAEEVFPRVRQGWPAVARPQTKET